MRHVVRFLLPLRSAVVLAASVATLGSSSARAQSCVTGTFDLYGDVQAISGTSGSGAMPLYFGEVRYSYASSGESATMRSYGWGRSKLAVDRVYTVLGVPAGTPVTQAIVVEYDGGGYNLAGCCADCTGNNSFAGLHLDDISISRISAGSHLGSTGCVGERYKASRTLVVVRPAGTPFKLTTEIGCNSNDLGNSDATMSMRFLNTTPGAILVRCDGSQVTQVVVGVGDDSPGALRISPVWPNPSHGVFQANVNVPLGAPAFLRVFDVSGRVMHARPVEPSATPRAISIDTRFAPGQYFVQLTQGARTAVQQVVVEN